MNFSHVPPGFRFHPTDEELVDYYLRRKVTSRIDIDVIRVVDLYKIEPWDLQDLCRIGTDEQNEWYFFSHKDKKYPTGTRTNRATTAGFWKATGRDKAIYSKLDLIGMRKTLVFYKGRAPNGQKSDWIMHEYRLETDENGTSQANGIYDNIVFEQCQQEGGWAVCKVFKKRITMQKMSEHRSPHWYDDQVSFMPDLDSPTQPSQSQNMNLVSLSFPCKRELDLAYHHQAPQDYYLQLPTLDNNHKLVSMQNAATTASSSNSFASYIDMNHITPLQSSFHTQEELSPQTHDQNFLPLYSLNQQAADQVTDWRVLDKFVASQLSHEVSKQEHNNFVSNAATKQEHNNFSNAATASTSTPTSQTDDDLPK